ncbi:MAG: sigma-54-dependent Fis family transcriptional regulator [Myxococcales bacterium]|nr:sigma-54-dependent Fis family transcriptional regulator [Myxococcales bacterium]
MWAIRALRQPDGPTRGAGSASNSIANAPQQVESINDEPADASGRGPEETRDTSGLAVLIVDDEPSIVDSLDRTLRREGFTVVTAPHAQRALEILRTQPIAVVISDLMMPGMTGLELLRASKAIAPQTEFVVMTAFGTVETAVDAMKEGAYDFVTKPIKRAHVIRIIRNAMDKQSLVMENRALRAQLAARDHRAMIGSSLPWRQCTETASQAAQSDASVLLLGESGTGKELLARAIHDQSRRASGPFVAINCAAIPESILEAELFGYEKGAFTGATTRREGRFEAANGGTLFLDEIGEIPKHVQVKLLRVLQEGEVEPLGASGKPRRIDIRLVAATNVNLAQEVKAGRFREDLYYRLHVIPLALPSLRDRRGDIPLLAAHFVQLYAAKNGRAALGISPAAMQKLVDYHWPGNVRELENTMERAVVLSRTDIVEAEILPAEVRGAAPSAGALSFHLGTPLAEIEMAVINETLRHTRGDKKAAAGLLGIATRTIYRRLEEGAAAELGELAAVGDREEEIAP